MIVDLILNRNRYRYHFAKNIIDISTTFAGEEQYLEYITVDIPEETFNDLVEISRCQLDSESDLAWNIHKWQIRKKKCVTYDKVVSLLRGEINGINND